MYKIVIGDEAGFEIKEIHQYIASDNIKYADIVIERLYGVMDYFTIFPYMGKEFGSFRKFVESKYKFIIVY